MTILLNRIQALAFFALLWGAWFNAALGGPLEAPSTPKKTVLVPYGEPLSVPANRMTEQGLTDGLSREDLLLVRLFETSYQGSSDGSNMNTRSESGLIRPKQLKLEGRQKHRIA